MSPARDPQSTGSDWESHAARLLEAEGLRILVRGYRCRLGELDIVADAGAMLVIVEVRARSSMSYQRAIETVGTEKRRRIVNATRHFLMRNPEWMNLPIRFDVIAIDGIDRQDPEIRWIRNAFDAA
jgi:putative endonuclease